MALLVKPRNTRNTRKDICCCLGATLFKFCVFRVFRGKILRFVNKKEKAAVEIAVRPGAFSETILIEKFIAFGEKGLA